MGPKWGGIFHSKIKRKGAQREVRPASSKAPKWPSLVLLHRLLLSWVSAPTWTLRPKTDLRPKNRPLDPDGGFASRFISPVFTHFHPFSLFLPIFTHFYPFSLFLLFLGSEEIWPFPGFPWFWGFKVGPLAFLASWVYEK